MEAETTALFQPQSQVDILLEAKPEAEHVEEATVVTAPSAPLQVDFKSNMDELEAAAAVALPSSRPPSPPSSPRVEALVQDDTKIEEIESGYASAASEGTSSMSSSMASLPKVHLSQSHVDFLNAQLENMAPMDILRFVKILFPNLYQSTAFGLTGLATIDMLDKIQKESASPSPPVDLIFLDTLYHFKETLDLVDRIKERYPNLKVHTFKPYGVQTTQEFEALYGEKVYEFASELYDYVAKVEPLQRAYDELSVSAVLTGRRRSQGGARGSIPVIELDEERGVLKINPMVNWSFNQVQEYIKTNNVPYNILLDQGYKSVGDWHSTVPVGAGEDERAGRWKNQNKTECGIHNHKSRYAGLAVAPEVVKA